MSENFGVTKMLTPTEYRTAMEWVMHDFEPPLDGWYATRGSEVILSFIASLDEGKGNLSRLLADWMTKYDQITVPTPSNRMRGICERRGFTSEMIDFGEPFNEVGEAMIWRKKS